MFTLVQGRTTPAPGLTPDSGIYTWWGFGLCYGRPVCSNYADATSQLGHIFRVRKMMRTLYLLIHNGFYAKISGTFLENILARASRPVVALEALPRTWPLTRIPHPPHKYFQENGGLNVLLHVSCRTTTMTKLHHIAKASSC
ncbi:hypothetical protein ElyMa_004449200 [Elysia marginata]|uniref:Uncharacterized protein n=1 Tax=Elysia marginata TaxID=1093978 RepID=A0AAV4HFX7_9GAST|nr:hypothetical protein ElyMa_004449200 [Elysia marginata]